MSTIVPEPKGESLTSDVISHMMGDGQVVGWSLEGILDQWHHQNG